MGTEYEILSRSPGRKRDQATRTAILRAAYDLIAAKGYRLLTIDEVSERSGASRSTIYRWWPTKGALATDAYLGQLAEEAVPGQTNSAVLDIRIAMRILAQALAGTNGEVLASIIGGGRDDPQILAMCMGMATGPRRERGRACFRRGIASGEFRADVNMESALDALFLPIFVRVLLKLGPSSDEWVDELARTVLSGVVAHPETPWTALPDTPVPPAPSAL